MAGSTDAGCGMGNGIERPAGVDGIEDRRDGKSPPGSDSISFLSWRRIGPFNEEIWSGPAARLQEMPKLVDFPDDLFLRGGLGFQGFLSWGFFWCWRTGVKTLAHFKVRQPRLSTPIPAHTRLATSWKSTIRSRRAVPGSGFPIKAPPERCRLRHAGDGKWEEIFRVASAGRYPRQNYLENRWRLSVSAHTTNPLPIGPSPLVVSTPTAAMDANKPCPMGANGQLLSLPSAYWPTWDGLYKSTMRATSAGSRGVVRFSSLPPWSSPLSASLFSP
jgi:hypothetical protein